DVTFFVMTARHQRGGQAAAPPMSAVAPPAFRSATHAVTRRPIARRISRLCRWGGRLLVALAAACGGPSAFHASDVDAFVAAHNAVRASAVPAPSPALPPLAWDDGVASTAQAWSSRCVFEHSHGALGENLAYESGDASTP